MLTRTKPLRVDQSKVKATIEPTPCEVCLKPFFKFNSLHTLCGSVRCATKLSSVRQKAERAKDKARKEELQPTRYWMGKAQEAFNKYVRLRDIGAGYGCIDCGRPFEPDKPGGSVDAGHYLSRGSAPHLKFDERNVFAQRKNCNRPGGTTRAALRAGVVARIGLAAVEALEADQSVKQYRAAELQEIIATYRARTKLLLAQLAE